MKFARCFATWLLMLALPLQAVAGYAPSAKCDDVQSAVIQPNEHHAVHQAAGHAEHGLQADSHSHPNESPAGDLNGHSCCHHVFPGVTASLLPLAPQAPNAVVSRTVFLNTLFIPELPQRPPRA